MTTALRQKIVIQKDGLIEIHAQELMKGTTADVIVLIDSDTHLQSSLQSMIGKVKGLYKTPYEVNNYIREHRNEWES